MRFDGSYDKTVCDLLSYLTFYDDCFQDLIVLCIDYMCSHIAMAANDNQLVTWYQYTLSLGHNIVALVSSYRLRLSSLFSCLPSYPPRAVRQLGEKSSDLPNRNGYSFL